jgi:hypothetical protein
MRRRRLRAEFDGARDHQQPGCARCCVLELEWLVRGAERRRFGRTTGYRHVVVARIGVPRRGQRGRSFAAARGFFSWTIGRYFRDNPGFPELRRSAESKHRVKKMRSLSYTASMLSLPRISAVSLLLAFVGVGGASGCLYDAGNRCDSGQKYDPSSGLCLCAGNTVAGDHGCVACGDHEIAQNDACVCEAGYQKPSGATVCAIIPTGLGNACTADKDCNVDPTYDTCHASGDSGYCTNAGCASDSDCTGGYACNTSGSASFCQRPPTGQGMACTSSDDCAGTEAPYCLTIQAHLCFVECSLTGNDCFSGYECCDLAALSSGLIPQQLCVPTGTCKAS